MTFYEMRKLTARKGNDYTTVCSLDYYYIKNHDRLIAVDIIRQNELDADLKATPQIEFVKLLKYVDSINADGAESVFNLTILEKFKETNLIFYATVL